MIYLESRAASNAKLQESKIVATNVEVHAKLFDLFASERLELYKCAS